ncbi:MAG: hypothetical protein A4S09_15885 [Proteobacteria bacterium SG_bin7]|nr:MAG: hypothetical protein A4S09_15885 [Proteobacteria bacterium SG_bin7]
MKKKHVHLIFLTVVLGMMGSGMLFYQGCGDGMSAGGATSTGMCNSSSAAAPIDKNYDIIPGQQTVSIAYGRPMLDSMVSCTGIGQPSTRTLNEWTSRNQSLSEYGNLTDVSGAMMMAVAAVAGEVCRDLLDKEKPLAIGSRGIFRDVDFTKVGSISSSEIESVSNLLGISCWQRVPTLDEKSMIASTIGQIGGNTDTGSLGLCTAMLSSLSALAQ